jgi:NOP9-like PUF repeat domain
MVLIHLLDFEAEIASQIFTRLVQHQVMVRRCWTFHACDGLSVLTARVRLRIGCIIFVPYVFLPSLYSIMRVPEEDMLRIAQSAFGTRVLDAIMSRLPEEVKAGFVYRLYKHFAKLACTKFGSRWVDRCFDEADIELKVCECMLCVWGGGGWMCITCVFLCLCLYVLGCLSVYICAYVCVCVCIHEILL